MPTNEYAAESGLLHKIQNTDITLVLDQYDTIILFHRVWLSMLLIRPIYLGVLCSTSLANVRRKARSDPYQGQSMVYYYTSSLSSTTK